MSASMRRRLSRAQPARAPYEAVNPIALFGQLIPCDRILHVSRTYPYMPELVLRSDCT